MLLKQDLVGFLTVGTVFAFDPDTLDPVAQVTYGPRGRVSMVHQDGRTDSGDWGIDGNHYWTRYKDFRDGSLNRFYLEPVDAQTAQAYHSDGRRAFLQSHKCSLSSD